MLTSCFRHCAGITACGTWTLRSRASKVSPIPCLASQHPIAIPLPIGICLGPRREFYNILGQDTIQPEMGLFEPLEVEHRLLRSNP